MSRNNKNRKRAKDSINKIYVDSSYTLRQKIDVKSVNLRAINHYKCFENE